MPTKPPGSNPTGPLSVPKLLKERVNRPFTAQFDENFDVFLLGAETDADSANPKKVALAIEKARAATAILKTMAEGVRQDRQQLEIAEQVLKAKLDAADDDHERDIVQKKLDDLKEQLDQLDKAAGEIEPMIKQVAVLGDRWLASLPGMRAGVAQPQKLAEKLLIDAVPQAGKASTLADLEHAAQHAQIATAQVLTSNALNPLGDAARPFRLRMKRAEVPDTPDTALWFRIRRSSLDLGWDKFNEFLDHLITSGSAETELAKSRIALPFPDCEPYRFLKAAAEVFLMVNCATWDSALSADPIEQADDLAYGERRLGHEYSAAEVEQAWDLYYGLAKSAAPEVPNILPYLALIRQKLGDVAIIGGLDSPMTTPALAAVSGIIRRKLSRPTLLELIWSYWHEEGMLVQTMNAITRRFQNIRTPGDRDPLAMIEIDPLRPLNNFLWGYIQDEQHRLTVVRRAYEYDHHYGLALVGKAVPGVSGADSRTRFIEAFHNLLHVSTIFFKEDDDTTVIADGFPVLNALRDVHIILSQGAHNQYGDLPWMARQEMMVQQWLLARPEMREFLPTRTMVAYPEPWMDRVDAMKTMMGWTDASVLHFRELAVYGERILLGARFNNWTEVIEPERAANWARFWRPEIQSYIHAYRATTGVDLSDRVETTMPSALLKTRLSAQRLAAGR